MSRPCPICGHPDRAAIDIALLNGKALRAIARDFNIGDHKKVARHRDNCMGDAYQAAMETTKVQHGQVIAARMRLLDEAVDEVLTRARKGRVLLDSDGHPTLDVNGSGEYITVYEDKIILAAVREGRKNAQVLALLAGAVPEADENELEKAREAQQDPAVRRLLAEAERLLAAKEAAQGTAKASE